MASDSFPSIQRRDFLKLAGAMTAFSFADHAFADSPLRVTVVIDGEDLVASSGAVQWAAGKLLKALAAKGATAAVVSSWSEAAAPKHNTDGSTFFVLLAAADSALAHRFSRPMQAMDSPESVVMTPGTVAGVPAIWIYAKDARGFVYGLLELAERVQFGSDPLIALHLSQAVEEKPANKVRSVLRAFCSEVEDKAWYYDKEFWLSYLDVLAASRFNRFNLSFGLAYDFPRGVTGDYFHFPYPYLVEVPGYNVRVVRVASHEGPQEPVPLSDEERDRNLQMLRFIAAETALRGLQFQLGLWTHAYAWTDSPHAHHRVEGLTPETHAAYCRDALAILLKSCPEIQGITLRVHYESGIPEGSYPFWKTLFEAISSCGRTIEIDMHAKGVNQIMIDMAADTGMPVKLGAKYSAEHQSLGYNQADIRKEEMPRADLPAADIAKMTLAARSFTRYGYADFFKQGSRYELLFRLWPGTQRHLLSGDPEMAAAYGRTSNFCGAAGQELMEPLTFKGREGSGMPGGRCAYLDASLNPKAGDWQKFEYYYRVWGRHLYNPDANPETYRRYLRSNFGAGANSVEVAVANASRVLPLVTTAHLPSASNHSFWPEMYDNMPIVSGSEPSPYSDTPNPKCFGTVSPLDPQLFSTIVEHASDLLAGRANAKYSPVEVAQWLEDFTATSTQALIAARVQVLSRRSAEFCRMEEDILIQNGLGRFFAAKLRSGVLFEIYKQAGSQDAGKLALIAYLKAREAWATMAERANRVYRPDITYGDIPMRRGHWSDRLASIDKDIAAMLPALAQPDSSKAAAPNAERAIQAAVGRPRRVSIHCGHTPPLVFQPGQPLTLSLLLADVTAQGGPASVNLLYRHVDQAERWQTMKMERDEHGYNASIAAEYTHSAYPLEYYFELLRGSGEAWLYPAFNRALSNQPYFAVSNRNA